MSRYDPQRDGPYGEWLKNKAVGFNPRGRSRTERVIDEGRLSTGEAYKTVQDELGNRVRERSAEMGVSTGQDVTIRAPELAIQTTAIERRQP
jgi:Fe2+ transport system protein FeoA